MREEEFKAYLLKRFENPRVISDCLSRCRRVSIWEGDLDQHYLHDRGRSILNKLTYSKDDLDQCKEHLNIVFRYRGKRDTYQSMKELIRYIKQ